VSAANSSLDFRVKAGPTLSWSRVESFPPHRSRRHKHRYYGLRERGYRFAVGLTFAPQTPRTPPRLTHRRNVKLLSHRSSPNPRVLSSSSMLRRAQALLLVLALFAAPLAVYARSVAGDVSACNGMCCLPEHHHSQVPAPAEQPAIAAEHSTPAAEMECHHHSAPAIKSSATKAHQSAAHTTATAQQMPSHCCEFHCAMHPRPHTMNFGLLAPIAPTKPSDLASIRIAVAPTSAIFATTVVAHSGHEASPFQPPRA
jgi:hypothetical protein